MKAVIISLALALVLPNLAGAQQPIPVPTPTPTPKVSKIKLPPVGKMVSDLHIGGHSSGVFQEINFGYQPVSWFALIGQIHHTSIIGDDLPERGDYNFIAFRAGVRLLATVGWFRAYAQATVGPGIITAELDGQSSAAAFTSAAFTSALQFRVLDSRPVELWLGVGGGVEVLKDGNFVGFDPRASLSLAVRWDL